MLPSLWRFIAGPLVTLLMGICLLLLRYYLGVVVLPGVSMFFPVLFAAYVGGIIPGLISAVMASGFVFVLLSGNAQLLSLSPDNLSRWLVLSVLATSTAVAVGLSRWREKRARDRMAAAHGDLATVRAALDEVDYVVMLLDRDLNVQFVNRAAYRDGGLRAGGGDEKPTSEELLREFATSGAYAVPADEVEKFVEKSLAIVRSGKAGLIDFRVNDGRIFRFRCNVLPDGGRMLIYSDVSDLVRSAEKLQMLAITDGLTGLFNQTYFLRVALNEWDRFARYGRSLSLILIDVDHFKAFNDEFGHEVGDKVLVHIAAHCAKDRRRTDLAGRIGGDELVILMPEAELAEAVGVAERLRQKLLETPLRIDDKELKVTASIGVAAAEAGMRDFGELRKRADQALYEAKRSGRNRVVPASQPLVTLSDAMVTLQSS
jgi:diguanylate cyclase (GGDEF)-like protein